MNRVLNTGAGLILRQPLATSYEFYFTRNFLYDKMDGILLHRIYKHGTQLNKYVWNLKEKEISFSIEWKIIKKIK